MMTGPTPMKKKGASLLSCLSAERPPFFLPEGRALPDGLCSVRAALSEERLVSADLRLPSALLPELPGEGRLPEADLRAPSCIPVLPMRLPFVAPGSREVPRGFSWGHWTSSPLACSPSAFLFPARLLSSLPRTVLSVRCCGEVDLFVYLSCLSVIYCFLTRLMRRPVFLKTGLIEQTSSCLLTNMICPAAAFSVRQRQGSQYIRI